MCAHLTRLICTSIEHRSFNGTVQYVWPSGKHDINLYRRMTPEREWSTRVLTIYINRHVQAL